ncbi:hypothetical protein [Helicobacter apodemus]|uniref:hypothetical protein n=1 Tax=Helicobacter apodemus TaxID=135569 RepID=UPI0013A53FEE|nr:hypothetical protein [Helicobacter apodemus]
MENEKRIAGFVVVYLNEFGEDDVIFCDSLEEAQKNSEKIEKQGYPTKIFKEVV